MWLERFVHRRSGRLLLRRSTSTYYFFAARRSGCLLWERDLAAARPLHLHPVGLLLRLLRRLLHDPGPRAALRPGRRVHRLARDDPALPATIADDDQPAREDEARRLPFGTHDDRRRRPDRRLPAGAATSSGSCCRSATRPRHLDGLLPVPLRRGPDRRDPPGVRGRAARRPALRTRWRRRDRGDQEAAGLYERRRS